MSGAEVPQVGPEGVGDAGDDLGHLGAVVVAVYSLVVRRIDLQGGTRVTLTARTPDGSRPTRDALLQAQSIISDRVNGLGVSGSEVIIDGDRFVGKKGRGRFLRRGPSQAPAGL